MNRWKKETDDHENVMLLAMSTLPRVPKINTYQIKDENGNRHYFSNGFIIIWDVLNLLIFLYRILWKN